MDPIDFCNCGAPVENLTEFLPMKRILRDSLSFFSSFSFLQLGVSVWIIIIVPLVATRRFPVYVIFMEQI